MPTAPFVIDSDTSEAAAESVEHVLGELQARVLAQLRSCGGATCDRVEELLEMRHQTASARIWELRHKGLIYDSGRRRLTRSGRRAVVWFTRSTRSTTQPREEDTVMASTRFYIGGCNRPFELEGSSGFTLVPAGLAACATRQLDDVKDQQQALGICRACEHATITAYLEVSPNEAEISSEGRRQALLAELVKGTETRPNLWDAGYQIDRQSYLRGVAEAGYDVYFWKHATQGGWLLEYFPSPLAETSPGPRITARTSQGQLQIHEVLKLPAPEVVAVPDEVSVVVGAAAEVPMVCSGCGTPSPAGATSCSNCGPFEANLGAVPVDGSARLAQSQAGSRFSSSGPNIANGPMTISSRKLKVAFDTAPMPTTPPDVGQARFDALEARIDKLTAAMEGLVVRPMVNGKRVPESTEPMPRFNISDTVSWTPLGQKHPTVGTVNAVLVSADGAPCYRISTPAGTWTILEKLLEPYVPVGDVFDQIDGVSEAPSPAPSPTSSPAPSGTAKAPYHTAGLDLAELTQCVLDTLSPNEKAILHKRGVIDEQGKPVATAAAVAPAPAPAPAPQIEPKEPKTDACPIDLNTLAAGTIPTTDGAPSTPRVSTATLGPRPQLRDLLGPGVVGGPSILGNSTITSFRQCMRRGFFRHVLGLEPLRDPERLVPDRSGDDRFATVKPSALDLGALVHACLEHHYSGLDPFEILNAVKPVYPTLAAEARRLTQQYLAVFAAEERTLWDVRFVEMESRYYYPKKRVKSAGRQVSLCVSARHDIGVREMLSGEGRLSPGTPARAIHLGDHKTAAKVSAASVDGFRHNSQVLQNLLTFNLGFAVERDTGKLSQVPNGERFGRATQFFITHIGKAIHHDPALHLRRIPYVVPDAMLEEFRASLGEWVYSELAERLFHKTAALDPATWPKSWMCRCPITDQLCPYLKVCEAGGLDQVALEAYFRPGPKLTGAALELPKKAGGGRKRKKATGG